MLPLLRAFLLLLPLIAAGMVYVRPIVPARELALRLALAHLCGAMALGLGVTLGLVVTNEVSPVWGALGLAGLALWGGIARPQVGRKEPGSIPAAPPVSTVEWMLVALLAVGMATAAARVVLLPLDWDGWAIWQFKARAMVDGSLKTLLTSPKFGYAHPDYPLLVPSSTWWLCGGQFEAKLAQVSGFLFLLDLLVLFYFSVRALTTRKLALLGCVVLVSWPLLMKHTASGFADLPLAAYVLGTAFYLAQGNSRLGLALLAGALLTKNEGLFTLLGAVFIALLGCFQEGRASHSASHNGWRALAGVGLTGLLVAGAWAVMKRRWVLNADLLDPSRWPKDLTAILLRRISGTLRGLVSEAIAVGPKYPGWGLFWPVAFLSVPLAARHRLRATLPLYLMCAAHLIGILTAYLVTPLDPTLHLSRSLDRLLLHIAPTLLLATLISLNSSHRNVEVAI